MNVALIIFNRPQHTERVFHRIAEARPSRLFVIADGPREGMPGEAENVAVVRAITENINWPCEVKRNYAEKNMGCGVRPFTGISWVFEQVDQCIILEDDCLADATFFRYCDELLCRYGDDERVVGISGNNFLGAPHGGCSYFASVYPFIWGWATWRRAWHAMDFKVNEWQTLRGTSWLNDVLQDGDAARYWSSRFDYVQGGRRDIWDVAWVFACWRLGGLFIHPRVNLVQNVGWGDSSTHTREANAVLDQQANSMAFPLRHPRRIVRCRQVDSRLFRRVFVPAPSLRELLASRHTYGRLVRRLPWFGPAWAEWRSRLGQASSGDSAT